MLLTTSLPSSKFLAVHSCDFWVAMVASGKNAAPASAGSYEIVVVVHLPHHGLPRIARRVGDGDGHLGCLVGEVRGVPDPVFDTLVQGCFAEAGRAGHVQRRMHRPQPRALPG